MNTLKGPGIFLAQFIDSTSPFNSLEGLATSGCKSRIQSVANSLQPQTYF